MRVEEQMARRREKEHSYQQMWNGADQYFRHWEKTNSRFDSWTSPRYYEDNNKLMSEIKNKREKEELLEKRREKLKKLLDEEQKSNDIEVMVHRAKNHSDKPPRPRLDEIPVEVLKDINVGLKMEEEKKRRQEAETKLYHQWRTNNPIIRQYESKYRCRDLKLSWLDQQIEKQMMKEKEEEEARLIIKQRDESLKKAAEEEEKFKNEVQVKKEELKESLERQMDELKKKQEIADELKKQEEEDARNKLKLTELQEKQAAEEKLREQREIALYNIKQHKLKLKKHATDVQQSLLYDSMVIGKLKELKLTEMIADEIKKREAKEGLDQFAKMVKEQQELEKQRQKHLDFLFDSEAKAIYQKQTNMWRQEELARQKLLKEVVDCIKSQIEGNLEKNREKQREVLFEREYMAKKIEEYDRELKALQEEEQRKKMEIKKMIDEDVKVKNARKKLQECFKLKEINEELDRIKKEEERLQQEILKIQQRQGPYKPQRSRVFL